jgi:hypothetical protein
MAAPYPITVTTTFDLGSSASFVVNPFKLNDATYGKLDSGVLGDSGSNPVDISSSVLKIKIGGGYNLLQDQFQANQGYVRVYDPNGWWNPQNTLSPYYPNLKPNKKLTIQTTYDGTTRYLFAGYVYAYNYTFPTPMSFGYVDLMVADGFRLLNMANIGTINGGTIVQTTGQRINTLLDAVQFPTALRAIDTGDNLVQADPGTNRQALSAIKNAEFTEQGGFYMSSSGKATFKSRSNIQKTNGAAPITYFSNDGSAITYAGVTFAHDDKLIVNQANFTNVGGTVQSYADSASISQFFPHTVTQTNLIGSTDAQTYNMAKIYVQTRKNTTIRIDQISLDLTTPNYAAGITAALTLDYFSTVNIKNVQSNGSTIQKTLQVMGSNYEITANSFDISFTTSEPIVDAFILDSSLYGILDQSILG